MSDPRTVTSGMAGLTASPSGNIKTEGAEFHLAVDYGTVNLVSAYRVLMPGYEVSAEDRIFDLFAGEVNTSVPQTIAFGTDNNGNPRGDFYWGAEAEQALARARASYDTVVTQWKVLLYDRHTNRGVASRVRSQFEQLGIDLETLIAQHLRKIIQAAKEHVRSSGVMGKAAKIIDTMPVKLFLGVPNIWESPANCAMVEAANAAGASHVELVLESECAAASYAHLIKHSPPRDHSPGDRVLIFDLGGGTGDLQVLEFVSEATDGAKVKLRTAGVAQGFLCGSARINAAFCKWAKGCAVRDYGSFEQVCALLGMSEVACLHLASGSFEDIKKKFVGPGGRAVDISVVGEEGALMERWTVRMTSDDVQSFFDPVVDEVLNHIGNHLDKDAKIKTVVIPGGFGKSEYLRERLQARFGGRGLHIDSAIQLSVGNYQPVARGALLRFEDIKARNIKTDEHFGIAQVESFNKYIHTDATIKSGRVQIDDFDGSRIVFERWCPLTKTIPGQVGNTSAAARITYANDVWQYQALKQGEKEFTVQIYWTKNSLAPHAPIRQGATALSPLVDGVATWGKPIAFDVGNLAEQGYTATRGEGSYRGWVWEFYWRIVLNVDGANVNVSLQMTNQANQPKYLDGGSLDTKGVRHFISKEPQPLSQEAFNHIPRTEM